MERLIRLAIIAILVVAAFKYGKPWLEQAMQGGSGAAVRVAGDGPGAECVNAAGRAREVCGWTLSALRPGATDPDVTTPLDDAIAEARSLCHCGTEACEHASAALDLLAETASRVRDPSRIGEALLGAARRLDQVDRLLEQAAAAASE